MLEAGGEHDAAGAAAAAGGPVDRRAPDPDGEAGGRRGVALPAVGRPGRLAA